MVTNATAAYTQSNATDQPSSNCADSIRLFSGSEKGLQRFYHASYRRYEDGRSSMVFECLYNYHHIEGDLEMFCIHNEFVGREPLCEIDPYMSKIYLVPFIAFVSFIFPAIWLVADFANFTRHRRQSRTIRFQHISKRGRIKGVNIQTDLTEFHRHPSSTSVDRFASLQASYVDLHFNEFEDDEDIFINKTTRRQVSRIQHGNKEFELLGAARAFGKLGKMMEKNFF